MNPFQLKTLVIAAGILSTTSLSAEVASPNKHSYADPALDRENFIHAKAPVNKFRLYNFYQRQADYYMAMPQSDLPKLLPAFPGLDAGKAGHWGKNNQNGHHDGRWNDAKIGSIHSHVTNGDGEKLGVVIKGINVKLPNGLATCFDPDSLNYRAVWTGWISFNPHRWGTSRGATITGDTSFTQKEPIPVEGGKYLGVYRHGEKVIFHYQIGDVEILDSPSSSNGQFTRTVEVISKGGQSTLPNLPGPKATYGELQKFTKGGTAAWPQTVTTNLKLGKQLKNAPYAIDTFEVPYQNPFNSVMQLSGIAFDDQDTIYVSNLIGEIWTVKPSTTDSNKLIWKRFASGLHVPFGLHFDKDGLFCLDRGQIYRFHDFNKDGEADYYESFANDFTDEGKSHTHTFGLHRQEDGAFYFVQKEQIMRTSPDGVTTEIGYGIRNGMGIGGSKDYFWIGPQEGIWTPASSIIEVEEGKHYGLPKEENPKPISNPMCFIPRAIDNSTGGFVKITSDKWGPFKGNHVGLSYGSNNQYLILRDPNGPKAQGATVPLEGEFLSGVVRGVFRPSDGQLYVVGLDGWGDYSIEDGNLERVRYTGGQIYKPSSFEVFENGIRVEFPFEIDPASLKDATNIFAQSWEYAFARGYGSPEFSAHSDKVGHDIVNVRSIQALDDKKSIFVEMPELTPVQVLYLRMHLKSKDGKEFKTDLFASPMYPQPYFSFEGAAEKITGKPSEIAVRIKKTNKNSRDKRAKTRPIEGAREIVVKAVSGLKYDKTLLEVNAGETIAIKFVNNDVMQHNLIIVKPGAYEKVGEASFKMLTNPKAADLNYTPKMKEVQVVVPVVDPNKQVTIYFRAPKKKGDYPFMCTFPGHWQAMRGSMKVK